MFALLLWVIAADTVDMNVDQALDIALKQSPVTVDARLDRMAGQSSYLRAWSAVTPQLNGSAGMSWQLGDSTTRSVSLSGGLSQVLFNPSTFGGIATGKIERQVADLKAEGKLKQQALDVRVGYYGLQKAFSLYDVAALAVKQAEGNSELAIRKQKLGSATRIDVLRAETNLRQANLDLMSAEQDLLSANESFKALLGTNDDIIVRPTAIDTTWLPLAEASQEEFWLQVEASNLTLELARQDRKSTGIARTVAYGELLPTLSGSVSRSYSGKNLPGSLSELSKNSRTSAGLNLGLPILSIQSRLLDIHDAGIDVERANNTLRSSEIQVRQSAADAFLSFRQATRQASYAGWRRSSTGSGGLCCSTC
jgi:outer membrane protein TolC